MQIDSLKSGFVIGFIWSILGQFGYLLVALIANIFLVRLLSPSEFGQMGIIMFFIMFSKVLTESGLSGSLIRKKEATKNDFSTVFIFNLCVSLLLFLVLIFFSKAISLYYNEPKLQSFLIALSFVLIINAFQIIYNAKLIKELKFKQKSIYTFNSMIISSLIGVLMAYNEYGVWSLVCMHLLNSLILTLQLMYFEESNIKFVFKKDSFLSLYKFGVNTTLASIIDTIFDNIYHLILGKYFSINQTGFFYQAKKLQEIPVGLIKSTTLGVVFSTLSKLQDSPIQFNLFFNRISKIFTIITGLICLIIFYYSEQIITLLYGEKWLPAVFFMKILIISSFFYIQEMLNRVLFKVFDRTDKILYLEIIKKIIQTFTLVFGVIMLDIKLLLYGYLFTSIVSYFINYFQSRVVYQGFSWSEIIIVVKVIIISIICLTFIEFIKNYLDINGYFVFVLSPFLLLLYILFTKILLRENLLKELLVLKNYVRKIN